MTNKEENESLSIWTKLFIAFILAVILTLVVSLLLVVFPWVPFEWYFPTLLLTGSAFFVGFGIYLVNQNKEFSSYSFILGILIEIGSIALATSLALLSIPVPFFGNALNVTIAAGFVLTILFFWLRPRVQVIAQSGPITTSAKSFTEQKQSIQRLFMQNKTETVLGLELIEEPHDYIFSDNDEKTPSSHIERFSGIVRSLFSTPYSICYQQYNSKTRVYFTTWSNDETQLSNQRTVLLDAIQYSLPKFKFRILDTFTGIQLGEQEKGSAAIITGVPLSVIDESQTQDPLENIVGVLRELENGIFQVFVEPVRMGKS
ncbi:MAG: hypothetical protein E4H14_19005, partial [Candidatus Thorarchaeota archaeon]